MQKLALAPEFILGLVLELALALKVLLQQVLVNEGITSISGVGSRATAGFRTGSSSRAGIVFSPQARAGPRVT